MKIVKSLIVTLALSAAAVTTAQARDSFSIGINIGGHDHHAHSVRTHRYAPTYYGHYGAPTVYYSAPRVVYYDAPVRYRHVYNNDHHYKRHYKRHYKGHDWKHYRGHHERRDSHRNHRR